MLQVIKKYFYIFGWLYGDIVAKLVWYILWFYLLDFLFQYLFFFSVLSCILVMDFSDESDIGETMFYNQYAELSFFLYAELNFSFIHWAQFSLNIESIKVVDHCFKSVSMKTTQLTAKRHIMVFDINLLLQPSRHCLD